MRKIMAFGIVFALVAVVFAGISMNVSAEVPSTTYNTTLVYATTENYVRSLTVFNGYLYATTEEGSSTMGKVYRSVDGTSWSVAKDFGYRVYSSAAFNGYLYVGLSNSQGIWRSSDGINYVQVHTGLQNYGGLKSIGNYLYAGGAFNRIERSSDGVFWTQVHNAGNVQEFAELNGKVFGASWNNPHTLYSSLDGINWGIDSNYPGSSATDIISTSNGILFVVSFNKLYKTTDGSTWSQISVPVSGDLGVRYHELAELNGEVYFPFTTSIYKTTDGSSWTFVAENSVWGDIDSMGVFNNKIYFGTNGQNNGKIYRLDYVVSSTIDIDPDTLNLKSKGKWITCYIEFPENYDVTNIAIDTILLNEEIQAESEPTQIGDYDKDGVSDLMVKFSRLDVFSIVSAGNNIEITITGELTDGTTFEGKDYITVIDKGSEHTDELAPSSIEG